MYAAAMVPFSIMADYVRFRLMFLLAKMPGKLCAVIP